MFWNHVCYLTISVCITTLVGLTLFRHGRLFLIDIFAGNCHVADAVNKLLLTGYILTNVAMVSLAIKFGTRAENLEQSVAFVIHQFFSVLLMLAVQHFVYLRVLSPTRSPQQAAATARNLGCPADDAREPPRSSP